MSVRHASSGVDAIPIVDLSGFRDGTPAGKRAVADAINDAAERIGFFYVANHGVAAAVIERGFAATRRLFDLPLEDKLAVKINPSHRGYIAMNGSAYDAKLKPNMNESFLVGFDLGPDDPDVRAGLAMHGPNQWPGGMPDVRADLEAYFAAMLGVGDVLLRASSLALGLPETWLGEHYAKPMPFLRCVHYPPQIGPRPDNQFGSAEHTDNGCLTLLAQDDVGGLQVKRRDGRWIDAISIPDTLVINIGDMLMRWTNDRWVSTPHRVINSSGRERYSMPFFFNPTFGTVVSCIESCRDAEHGAKYPPITWGEYLTARFNKTYAYRNQSNQRAG